MNCYSSERHSSTLLHQSADREDINGEFYMMQERDRDKSHEQGISWLVDVVGGPSRRTHVGSSYHHTTLPPYHPRRDRHVGSAGIFFYYIGTVSQKITTKNGWGFT